MAAAQGVQEEALRAPAAVVAAVSAAAGVRRARAA